MKKTLINQHVLVLGLGETGQSAMRWLLRQGAQVAMADSRLHPPGIDALAQQYPQLQIHTGPFEAEVLAWQLYRFY